MAVAQVPFLAAVLLLFSSGFHCSTTPPACPESCTCQRAPLLNCSSSGLSSVPQHIQDSVTELDLSHNLLDFVTLHQQHHNLRNVWLGNNSITRLSLCIERAPGSQYVRGRRLHRLRPWSRGCVSWAPTLQLLSVERNQLVQFPEGLDGSESLEVLQLSFNRISTLQPGVLSNLRQLKELHLQHNLITSLHPQMFQDLAQLRVLDLSSNMLTSLHPLMYLSLRNIGADVSLGGNRWQCDCSMRSLRRRMAFDSSRSLQSWNIVCASPSILSGRDLLQLEENDLSCFGTENRPELHQDVTVYSGSEILLTCSMQDSLWWTPNGQASVSQPQAGLLIRDITEGDTGLYVCMSEEHEVVSVFNLHISKIGGTRRKTRSLSRTTQKLIAQGTSNRVGQEGKQRTQSEFVLAVCLSVFITFLVAFILGVLARPLFDVLCRRITKKKSSSQTNHVSSVEERQYDNEAYCDVDELEETRTYRERRVTFSTVDVKEDLNVQYYDSVVHGGQESINNDPVTECEAAEAKKDQHTADDSGSENSLRQNRPEDDQKDGRDHTHNMEVEHIADRVVLEERRSSSSHSDSSLSDKELKEDQMTQGHHTLPKSPQLAEDSVQQSADFSTARKVNVPQFAIEGTSEIPAFSSEPFVDWLPHTNIHNPKDAELWQEDGEPFEFSDSVRSTSAQSSSMFGSFKHSKLIAAPTPDKQRGGDMSSSSSYVSDDRPSQYTANSDQEEEEDIVRNYTEPDVSFEQQIHNTEPVRPSVGFNHDDYKHEIKIKKRLAPSPPVDSSSRRESEDETTYHIDKQEQKTHMETQWPTVNLEHTMRINRRLDIKASSPTFVSSSSSDSEDETTGYTKKQRPGKVNIAALPRPSQAESDPETQWPILELEHIPRITRRLDIKAPSPPPDSSSRSEDDTTGYTEKQRSAKVNFTDIPFQETQAKNHDPETQWPTIDLGHTTRIKRRLDIKAPTPTSDSSSTTDSEHETIGYTGKRRPRKVNVAGLLFHEVESHDSETQWPILELEHIPRITRRLDIKAPSPPPDSSSYSDSEDGTTGYIEKQRPAKGNIAALPFQESQAESHDPETQWPTMDLECTTRIKRRLDIRAPSPTSDSSSNSDSEHETTTHIKKQEHGETHIVRPLIDVSQAVRHDPETQWPSLDLEHIPRIKRRLDIKAPSPPPDDSSSKSEDKTTGYVEKQRPAHVNIAALPFPESQAKSHDPETQWPILDLEHTTRVKRHLDIRVPSPTSDSSSTSDSADETTNQIKKQGQGEMHMARPPINVSQTVSHDPETQWPSLDLEHIPRIERRLDIKAPSPPPDSSSESEDKTTSYIEWQRPAHMNIAARPFPESQTESHDPETQWPLLDLERTTRIKRHLDIKAPSNTFDSSSSESEDEATNHVKKQGQRETYVARPPIKVSQTVNHEPETQWPSLDLEHIPHIKRRLDIKAPSPPPDDTFSKSEDKTKGYVEKQRPAHVNIAALPFQESQAESQDPETQWPILDLEHTTRVKRHLDIRAPSPTSDSSSRSESDDETTGYTEKQEPGRADIAGFPFQKSQTASYDLVTQWPAVDLGGNTRIKRRLDIKAPSPPPDSLSNGASQGSLHSKSNSSTSNSEDEDSVHKTKPSMGAYATEKEFIKSPKTPMMNISHRTNTDHNIELQKYTVITDGLRDKATSDNISTAPEVNPELQARWSTMNLGFSRFRKHLEITPHEPPNQPSSPPPDTQSYLNPENKQVNVSLSLMGQDDNFDNSVEVEDRLRKAYSLPTTEDHSAPDLSFGIPHVKRRLNIKAPSPQPSNSPSSCSDSENEVEGYTTKQTYSRHTSNLSGKTDAQEGSSHSMGDRNDPFFPRRVPNVSFDSAVKKRIDQSRHTEDVDLPPEIRWTGVDYHLSDLSISSPRKHLDVNSSSPQQAPFVKPEQPPPDSSNSSCSEDDDKIKQRRGEVDATSMHKYSSLSSSSVSLSSNRVFGKLDNSSTNTNEIRRVVSTDRKERKGLSALKAMSSDRRKWDTEDKTLLSLTSGNKRNAEDLLYDIPSYRSHAIGAFDLPKERPPPVPETPLPDEFTWRSAQNSQKEYERTTSNLQQTRSMEEPYSLTSDNLAVYIDSSNQISEV